MRFSKGGIINRSNDKRCLSFSVRCRCLTFKHMERIRICGLYLLTPTMLNTCSFQKYFREQFSEYHSSACATMISHCKEKWKLLLWGGDLIENRKKLTCQLIMDIWRYSSNDTDVFPYNSCTRDYMEMSFANTSGGWRGRVCFFPWDFVICICGDTSGDKENLFKHIYENQF